MADISVISPDGGTTELNIKDSTARTNIGNLADLTTTAKTNLVAAINEAATGGGGTWGSITGTLSDQTDLQTALDGKQATLTFDNVPTNGSNNPVKSGGIKTAIDSSFSASETEIRDTVGWVGKNLADITVTNTSDFAHSVPLPTGVRNITLSAKSNGTGQLNYKVYDSSGNLIIKASALILDGETSGSADITLSDDGYIVVYVLSGAHLGNFSEVMVKRTEVVDNTFEPYHKSVDDAINDVYDVMGENGAVNRCPNYGTSQTVNGVVFIVNSENGKVVATTPSTFTTRGNIGWTIHLPEGTYRGTGAPGNGFEINYQVQSPSVTNYIDTGSGVDIIIPSGGSDVKVWLNVELVAGADKTATFEPMITLPSYTGDYVPYAMTNRELTDELTVKESAVVTENSTDINKIYKSGKVVSMSLIVSAGLNITAWSTVLGTLPEGYRPKVNIQFPIFESGDSTPRLCQIETNGEIVTSPSKTGAGTLRMSATWITS